MASDHTLAVTLSVLGAIQEYDRVQVRNAADPQLESTAFWGFGQAVGRLIRGESREDTIRRLRDIVTDAERRADCAVVLDECEGAARGLERLKVTYHGDTRMTSELTHLSRRLAQIGAAARNNGTPEALRQGSPPHHEHDSERGGTASGE